MRAKHSKQQGFFTTIATKISHEDRNRLAAIANGFGMSMYELLQALLMAIVRYFDVGSLITYEHNAMMNAFANTIFSLKDSYSPISLQGNKKRTISHAILFMEQNLCSRPQLLAIDKDTSGNLMESYNIDTMLSNFMGALDNEALQAIRREQEKQGYFSLAHTLHEIILQRTDKPADSMSQEIESMFKDVRTTTGEKVNEDLYYKRIKNKWEEYTAPTPHKGMHKVEL